MTQQLHTVSHELNRITNYTAVMAKLANQGLKADIDTAQLQTIFCDIAKGYFTKISFICSFSTIIPF